VGMVLSARRRASGPRLGERRQGGRGDLSEQGKDPAMAGKKLGLQSPSISGSINRAPLRSHRCRIRSRPICHR